MPCMNCRFSEPPTDAKGNVVLGQPMRICKRMPPVPIALAGPQGQLQLTSAWPQVPLMAQCFEFQAMAVGQVVEVSNDSAPGGKETAQ